MTRCLILCSLCWMTASAAASDIPPETADESASPQTPDLVVVIGASGAEEFEVPFREAARRWEDVGGKANANVRIIGRGSSEETEANDDANDDRTRLRAAIERSNVATDLPLWVVLIGHGTFAGNVAKFNLTGPDVAAEELSNWLEDFQRPLILINGASSSGPFINQLSAPGRVIVTATQSGAEQNYARFGQYFAKAIGDLDADIDHDDTVSVLEAFLQAAAATQEFYESEGRLATEHALLDDNGDGLGTSADFFRGVRAIKSPSEGAEVDGELARRYSLFAGEDFAPLTAQQREQRDQLEQQIRSLREQKETLSEEAYFEQLHDLALQLARLYQDAEGSQARQEEPEDEAAEEPSPSRLQEDRTQ